MGTISGNFKGTNGPGGKFVAQIEWKATTNTSGNYSDVTSELWFYSQSGASLYCTARGNQGWQDGSFKSLGDTSISTSGGNWVKIGSWSQRVNHNADGTGSTQLWGKINTAATIAGWGYMSAIETPTRTITLEKIPRQSTVSDTMSGTRYLGTSHTITINRAVSTFKHTVWYRVRGSSGVSDWFLSGENVGATHTFTPTESKINLEPKSKIMLMDICIRTFDANGKKIGEDTYSNGWNMKIPESYAPTLTSFTVSDGNADVAAKFGFFVQSNSRIKGHFSANAKSSAWIKRYLINFNGVRTSETQPFLHDLINKSGSLTVLGGVQDSRGFYTWKSFQINVQSYLPPEIKRMIAFRADSNGNEDDEGTRLRIERLFIVTPLENKNDNHYKVEVDTGDGWTVVDSGNSYALNDFITPTTHIGGDKTARVRLTVADFFTTAVQYFQVDTTYSLLDFHKSGTGLAVGKVATKADLFDLNLPIKARRFINGRFTKYTPTFLNGFQNYASWVQSVEVWQDACGMVHVRGSVKTTASNYIYKPIFILPPVWRPPKVLYFSIPGDKNSGHCNIQIEPNGGVSTNSNQPGFIPLDVIHFHPAADPANYSID